MIYFYIKRFYLILLIFSNPVLSSAQDMTKMWDKESAEKEHDNIQWFKDAKFGMFIHWGLYSKLAGVWKGKNYYGSGEWIMHQAKIPVPEYAKVASEFNPVDFNAEQWAKLAKDAGIKYIVITAKHHEGFAMYDSKISDFNIVKASPYKKDPMKALSEASRKQGIQFGFYYSQFQDWHEPNGGGNDWDFNEKKKNYQQYYREKALPQLKELLTNYGPLGIVWFDTPGGLSKKETQKLIDELRVIQPKSLFSSRVGQGLGDYKDFGDSEVPPALIAGAWESIYTHNDSWGYIQHDMNFKSSTQIIQLLANVSSKGGNLMLNVGPDGKGNIPPYSVKYLKETGKWLDRFGESIYGSTFGIIPAQPWGVTTSKTGKLFLHILNYPKNGKLMVPGFSNQVTNISSLENKDKLDFKKTGEDIEISLRENDLDNPDQVLVLEYEGKPQSYDQNLPVIVSSQYELNSVDAIMGKVSGKAKIESITFSHYFGDWKHETCVTEMRKPTDSVTFQVRVTEPGDYKIHLEYACTEEGSKQEGVLEFDQKTFFFETLRTSDFSVYKPMLFIKHPVATVTIDKAGIYNLVVKPLKEGKELFKLKSIILEPLK
ncbi:alpha-L-fucosidase [Dyadobacter frigoris]|uniref:alpha-L-fucosidase n=1 Tax=Dyadobacter frigoris TaxID=2576211 RepID=A0A4U6CSV5_9BACT|nr:alpha-L-fucosidase [Dyadobacter frigoris]TKT86637.1 alpha-L-fucosidase [Dyadobacter frigoris]GLU56813.1 hypothetical protein Dfri01_62740 [Dyadobacter frigoris]